MCMQSKYQEEVEQIVVNSSEKKDNLENEIQQRMLQLENDFFSMQLETKNPLEKVASSWTKGIAHYNTSMTHLSKMAKNFYNHEMMMGLDKPILKQKPMTHFTSELFHIREGISYYKAIEDFTKSISLMPLLKQREQPYAMRATTYGRIGKLKDQVD